MECCAIFAGSSRVRSPSERADAIAHSSVALLLVMAVNLKDVAGEGEACPHEGSRGSTACICVQGAPDCSHEFWEYLSTFDETENEEDALKLVAATLVVATSLMCTCLITRGCIRFVRKMG